MRVYVYLHSKTYVAEVTYFWNHIMQKRWEIISSLVPAAFFIDWFFDYAFA